MVRAFAGDSTMTSFVDMSSRGGMDSGRGLGETDPNFYDQSAPMSRFGW
jgi:hypothetical protein